MRDGGPYLDDVQALEDERKRAIAEAEWTQTDSPVEKKDSEPMLVSEGGEDFPADFPTSPFGEAGK